tara:strand:+ start:17810 stop:18901 length:1092 start_codon:yes stop_codon:yes gene_type:complete
MAKVKRKKQSSPIRGLMSPVKMAIPILIGVSLAGYLLVRDLDLKVLSAIEFSGTVIGMLGLSLLFAALRDVGYMFRLRTLSEKKIAWRNIFDDIMLWEFSSAITPSVVGGSGVAIFILSKEGIATGRSTAIVMITAFLDELFYVVMVPFLFLFAGTNLFPDSVPTLEVMGYTLGIKQVFWIGYGFMIFLVSLIFYGIFISPQGFKKLLEFVFRIPFLRKWQEAASQTGFEIITTSTELKGKPKEFWIKTFGSTALSWTSRFLVANFLLMAFTALSFSENILVLSRQLIMWVIMLISPTPGSAGVAELAFGSFLSDYTPLGLAVVLAVLWRLFTYYPYLFIGAIVLPNWIQRVYLKRKLITFKN